MGGILLGNKVCGVVGRSSLDEGGNSARCIKWHGDRGFQGEML